MYRPLTLCVTTSWCRLVSIGQYRENGSISMLRNQVKQSLNDMSHEQCQTRPTRPRAARGAVVQSAFSCHLDQKTKTRHVPVLVNDTGMRQKRQEDTSYHTFCSLRTGYKWRSSAAVFAQTENRITIIAVHSSPSLNICPLLAVF